ncbi:MAG: hypothetical protein K2Y22_15855 [Candidatus Obscuribacterales bacterium]|nr:hypothetical protein [Candidatus Obscuribacterales bacterium]
MDEATSDEKQIPDMLEKAIAIAVEAHKGQKDKMGTPYVLHPLRMMCRMTTPYEMMAAVLHDVVEDTSVTLAQLKTEGIPEVVLDAIDRLSRREGESYDEFVQRILPSPLACRVKLADLEDNMDVRRIKPPISEKDLERLNKYRHYWDIVRGEGKPENASV